MGLIYKNQVRWFETLVRQFASQQSLNQKFSPTQFVGCYLQFTDRQPKLVAFCYYLLHVTTLIMNI